MAAEKMQAFNIEGPQSEVKIEDEDDLLLAKMGYK